MVNKVLICKLIKKNGRLVYDRAADLSMFNKLVKDLPEGSRVEQMVNFSEEDGLLSQLAKIHAMIREIADETGETFARTKKVVKEDCGMKKSDGTFKSFGDCSKTELSDVIQHLIDLGDSLNLQLR